MINGKMMEIHKLEDKKDPQALEWLNANRDRNSFDEDVLMYPASELWSGIKDGKACGYIPVQTVLVMESIGFNPESTIPEKASTMFEFAQAALFLAQREGMREVMFLVSDEVTAEASKVLGFEELNCRVMRRKIKP